MKQQATFDPVIEARVEELLSRMTLEEKAAQMVQIPYRMVPREEALDWARKGAGSFLHVLGDDAREVQSIALSTRLGIPVLFGIDAIHGHGLNEQATIFPSQLAAACSWNPALVEEMGRVTAREVATDGLHWTFSPVLCLATIGGSVLGFLIFKRLPILQLKKMVYVLMICAGLYYLFF